jgi:methyltransferase (TIGR00027 family)
VTHVTDRPAPARAATARGQTRASATAEITCAQRAAETLAPADRRLVDDPYARYFLRSLAFKLRVGSRPMARLTRTVFDRRYPGFMAVVLLRNRWYEEVLAEAVRDGITQVVLLGAGYDTTALRLDLGDATLYEVDAPPTQEAKREALSRHGLQPQGRVEYVPCDFERDSLVGRLRAHGFDPDRPSLVVWFGVSFFLTEPAVRQTVSDVETLSAPGSRFLWDYMHSSVVDGTTTYAGARRASAAVARRGEPYTFGLDRLGAVAFMESYGFRVRDHLTMTDLGSRYGGASGVWCSTDDFFGVITAERLGGADR